MRGRKDTSGLFIHDEHGAPYEERHIHNPAPKSSAVRYTRIPDRETGAQQRLGRIMARYPEFTYYVQTDPRGAALYILRPGDVKDGRTVDSCYTNGVAVFK